MEVTRLILVLQILGSTWSKAEHRYSENGFDPAAWIAQYTSSPYRPRSIQDNIYFNMTTESTTAKPEHTTEQMLDMIGEGLRTEPSASPLNEKAIVSALLRYGQHHKYVLKTVLRGLKLLRDSSILDVRQCVREALFKADHATESTVLEQEEEKYIVKALLTEPNYMEFCVHKTAHKNLRKQVYDSLMTEISSVIKNRQVKQLVASPDAMSSTTLIAELDQTTTPADPVEKIEGTTTSPTTASSNSELQQSSTTPSTEGPSGETQPPRTTLASTEVTLAREGINIALNKEVLTSGFSHQITKPYQPYTSTVPNKIHSKIPLIYHLGTISAPGFNYVPHPYLSIFTVGEIDPQVMAEKAIPIHYPEFHRAHVPSTTTEEFPMNPTINIQDNEDSTLEVTEVSPQTETLGTVKKMLSDDEFEWPGPFAMERQRVIRSPTKFSLDVPNMEDQEDARDMTDEGTLSPENNREPKEYLLPLMISEPIPVISVPGEIPDLGKELNVVKEFAEPASTVEPPIVLKVQRVPTHVDTSEFWNARKDEHVQESSSIYPSQVSEEANIRAFLDGLRTTETSVMRESKMLKEETVTDSLFKDSEQTITVTERFLETTTEYNKIPTAAVLLSKEAAESSNESASNESASSSEEEEASFESNQTVSGEDVYGTTAQDTTEEPIQTVTQVASERSAASEESTTAEGATVESLAYSTTKTSAERTESTSTTIIDENGSDITDQTPIVSTLTSDPIDVLAETTVVNRGASDITEEPIEHTESATTVTSSEGNKISQGVAWDPDFDFVIEEFSASHIAKDDIPFEYMDYSLSLLGELAKSMTELTAKSTMLKSGKPASSETVNETQALSPTEKDVEDGSAADGKDSQPTSEFTTHLPDKEKESMEVLTSFQDDPKQKEPSGLQHSAISSRSRRQVKLQEVPSEVLKLLKDKGLNTDTMLYHRGSSASGNQIPVSPQKFSKSRTQKILLSLDDKRRKSIDEDSENETDSDNSFDESASIMELIDVNRVSHILDEGQKKA